MDAQLFAVFNVVVTPWKLIGYLGVGLFAGRWVVQMFATRRLGRPAFPGLFWGMSVAGSALLLAYFVWGKNDSVGVMSNLFPMAVAVYNSVMHRRARRAPEPAPNRTSRRFGRDPGPAPARISPVGDSQDESLTMIRA